MAISFDKYFDDRMFEKIGITPKIKVSSGQDTLDYAWNDFFKK